MNVGDMVKASYMSDALRSHASGMSGWPTFTGIVTNIQKQKSLFSDKYAIIEVETIVEVLCEGTIKKFVLEEDKIEVINADR